MKTLFRQIPVMLFLAGAAPTGVLFAAAPAPADDRVTVRFFEPANFTDLKENATDFENERGRDHFLPLLRDYLQARAARYLGDGQSLTITFTDIDLAGEFEPGRGLAFYDTRIVRSLYVPRLAFSFRVVGPDGELLKEGTRKLLDGSFQMRGMSMSDSDSLRYEKAMLDDWLRKEFSAGKR